MKRVLVLLTFISAGPALAQTRAQGTEKTSAAPVQHIIVGEDENVEVGPVSPEGSCVAGHWRLKMRSMLRVRTDFVPEMIRSADDL